MPSTYTGAGIELIGDGEKSGTWGQTTNNNLNALDRLTSQATTVSLTGTTGTVQILDGTEADGQYAVLVFGGSPSGTNTVTITPNDAQRLFHVKNSSGQDVVLTQGSGGNVTVGNGKTAIVYCDGAGSGAEVVDLSAGLITATLTAIGALTPTDGNFIVGNGSTWVAESGDTAIASLGVTATGAELNLLDGVTWTLTDYNTLTSTAAELNLLDGVTWTLTDYNALTSTAAELNILDGATVTVAEVNILDGDTAATATTLADADRLVANDDGTMVQVAMTDVRDYLLIDEDDMASDSATKLPTQQSVKAYVDGKAWTYLAAQAATSGSALDFTGIPATAREVEIYYWNVSLSGNDNHLVQAIVSGAPVTSGYVCGNSAASTSTSGMEIDADGSANAITGHMRWFRFTNNDWLQTHMLMQNATGGVTYGAGRVSLAGALEGLRATRSGSATFDLGSIQVRYR